MSQSELPSLPQRSVLLWIVAGFVLLLFGIYGASLRNDFVRWDDGLLIYENPAMRQISPTTLKTIFTTYDPELYIPLTFLSYQIDYQLGGVHAFVYHLQNLLWHTLNALLVVWLLFLLSRRGWIAIIAGLLFAVHPLNVEAVVWASARKDLLATFFFLGSTIAYLCGRDRRSGRLYWLSLGLFLLGLLSKVVIVTLPLALLLIDDLQGRKWNRWILLEKLPYFVLALIFGLIALGGKHDQLTATPLLTMLLLGIKSSVLYLQLLLWPTHFSVLYPYTGVVSLLSADFFVPLIILFVLIATAFVLRRRARVLSFAIMFYLLTLIPTFTNLAKGEDTYLGSDRYAYIPSIVIYLLVATGLFVLVQRVHQKRMEQGVNGVVAVLIVLLGAKSMQQATVWADTTALFQNVIAQYPDSEIAHNNLGNAYRRRGQLDDAVKEFQIALKSASTARRHSSAKIHSNLGAVYRKQGQMDAALEQYRLALAADPKSDEAYFGQGIVYAAMDEDDQAFASYAKALAIQPDYPDVYINRGALHVQRDELDDAQKDFQQAIALEPLYMQAHYNLAVLYEKLKKPAEAQKEYETTVSLQTDYTPARINLGLLYYSEHDIPRARAQFESILRYDPANAAARSALAQLQGTE